MAHRRATVYKYIRIGPHKWRAFSHRYWVDEQLKVYKQPDIPENRIKIR